jgi:DNA repair protein RadC
LDWTSRPEVLAISSRSPATSEPVRAFRAGSSPARRPVGLCPSQKLSDPDGLFGADGRYGELPAPRSGAEALGLVPGLRWPGDGTLLAQAFVSMANAQTETLLVTLHDRRGSYVGTFQREGGHGGIELDYRDLIEVALANRAGGLLLIHNHPSGDPRPSADDIGATRMLAALCRPLQLALHDHLVVGARGLVSMRRAGFIHDRQATAA